MVPISSIITMAVCAVVGIAAPVALAWWMVRKYKVKLTTILIGAATFFIFALLLEPILHQLVLKGPHGAAITGNIWYYALYGGLAAGLFEETCRLLAMKFLLRKEPSNALTGVAYGVGHGGLEMLLIFGVTMISNIAIAAMINSGQADTLLATAPAEVQAQVQAQFEQLQSSSAGMYLFGLWERFSAIILQLGLSVLVWAAVRKGGKWLWLFPAAIVLHALVDGCAVIVSKTAGILPTEIIVFCLALAVGAMAWLTGRIMNACE